MVFKVVVDYYDDFDKKENKRGLFLMADSYSNVIEKLVNYYGEEDLLEIKITPWSPDDFVKFDLDNSDEDWLFNKVDKDIGEKVIWQQIFEVVGLLVYL